jgi:hypothetical protein
MADDIKASGLFRDAFALLVTGPLVTQQKATDERGIGLDDSEKCGTKWENNIKQAQATFVARVEEKHNYLHSLKWLHDLPCFARLNEVVDNPRVSKAFRATTLALIETIEDELRRNLSSVMDNRSCLTGSSEVEYWSTFNMELSLFQMIPEERRRYSSYYWSQGIQYLPLSLLTPRVQHVKDWWLGRAAYEVWGTIFASNEGPKPENKGKGLESATGDDADTIPRMGILEVRPALTQNNNRSV